MMDLEGASNDNASNLVSLDNKKRKKLKRKNKKHKQKKKKREEASDSELERIKKSKSKKRKKSKTKKLLNKMKTSESVLTDLPGPSVPTALIQEHSRSKAPITKEEWEKSQSVVRRVYDESTGRSRLIKGDGEVLEEIVSKERHHEINKQATIGDGEYFQNHLQKK